MPRATTRPRRPSARKRLQPKLEAFLAARRARFEFTLPSVTDVGFDGFQRAADEMARLERELNARAYDAAFSAALYLDIPLGEAPQTSRAARCDGPDGAGRSNAPDEPAPRALESIPVALGG